MMLDWLNEHLKNIIDALAAGISFASLLNMLPYLSAGLSIVWLGVRLYDRYKYGPSIKE